MQTQAFENPIIANQNNNGNSFAKIAGLNNERLCWSMLLEVAKVINLPCADIIEVSGSNAASHIALLARQFPTLSFALNAHDCENDASRILWLYDEDFLNLNGCNIEIYDAIIVCHKVENSRKVIAQLEGFARIAAKREIVDNHALSVFGRGLMRDLFKPRVRGQMAA